MRGQIFINNLIEPPPIFANIKIRYEVKFARTPGLIKS